MKRHPPKRCLWCHGAEGELRQIDITGKAWDDGPVHVHPEHEQRLRSFVKRVEGRSTLFISLTVLAVFVVMNSTLVGIMVTWALGLAIMGAALSGLGAVCLAMPFATTQTVRAVGVLRSIRIAQMVGLGTGAFGIGLLAVALFNLLK